MGVFDHLLNTVRLNDDYDDDFYDEEDSIEEEEEPVKENKNKAKKESKVNSRFSKKMEEDDLDDFLDDEPVKPKKKKAVHEKAEKPASSYSSGRSSKITPIKKAGEAEMEVCVIKPTSMEETKEITDTLRDRCTVVLNLEGLDVETAQRIIDFVSGASYAVDGKLRMVSSFIFLLTPSGVEISGDIQDFLGDAAPDIRTEF